MSVLPFQQLIVNEMKSSKEGGILLISKGLGLHFILSEFLKTFSDSVMSIIFFLNFDEDDIECMNEILKSFNITKQITTITNEVSTKRSQLYMQGGFFSLSNIIFIFDIMQNTIPASIITGILINKIERIRNDYDKEFFISTLLRLENLKAFIFGISEDIETFSNKWNLEKMLKNFYLNNVLLWPSCRLEVQEQLMRQEENENNGNMSSFSTIEKIIDLTPLMKKVQRKIMKLISCLIKEINRIFRKSNNNEDLLTEYEVSSMTVFSLTKKTNQINETIPYFACHPFVKDLKNFKQLLVDVIIMDACGFLKRINKIRDDPSLESIWFIADNTIIELCDSLMKCVKKRVYYVEELLTIQKVKIFFENSNPQTSIRCNNQESTLQIEENEVKKPDLIGTILTQKTNVSNLNSIEKSDYDANRNKTFYCSESSQIEDDFKSIKPRFISLLDRIALNNENSVNFQDKKNPNTNTNITELLFQLPDQNEKIEIESEIIKNENIYDFSTKFNLVLNLEINPKLESLRKLIENLVAKRQLELENKKDNEKNPVIWIHANQESKVRELREFLYNVFQKEDKNTFEVYKELYWCLKSIQSQQTPTIQKLIQNKNFELDQKDFSETILLENCFQELNETLSKIREFNVLLHSQNFEKEEDKKIIGEKLFNFFFNNYESKFLNPNVLNLIKQDNYDSSGNKIIEDEKLVPNFKVIVNSIRNSSIRHMFLKKNNPKYVILFEPNMSIIRELLIHQATLKNECILDKVYILMFKNSAESANYLNTVKRENRCFELILQEKSKLPLLSEEPTQHIKKIMMNVSTRVGRGLNNSEDNKPIIIIDKREFKCNLPTKLFFEGFQIIPMMIEKGDYILTDEICVERKAVSTGDLIESLKGGRLEKQIKKILESYKKCVLLIEFSEDAEFSFDVAKVFF